MRNAKIITLVRNEGERSDCNNYRGISLLSITGKVFAKVILIRLQKMAERVYPESQCGFRAGRSTIGMVFSARQLQEKCREQQMQDLQALMDYFSQACKDFGLTISLKETNVLGQDTMELSAIAVDDYELDVVEQFAYLGPTITDNLSLDT